MVVEDLVSAAQRTPAPAPCCWLALQGGRPLQCLPPDCSTPFLLVFTSLARGEAFLAAHHALYGPQTTALLPLASAASLRALALAGSAAAGYEEPPCGILLNADPTYQQAQSRLTPDQTLQLTPEALAEALGLPKSAPTPPHEPPPPSRPARSRLWILLAVLGLPLCLLLLCIGAYFSKDQIPPLAAVLNSPTPTPSPTLTPTPTFTPTPTGTPTPSPTPNTTATFAVLAQASTDLVSTQVMATLLSRSALPLKILDLFDNNSRRWIIGAVDNEYTQENRFIADGKFTWVEAAHKAFSAHTCALDDLFVDDFFFTVEAEQIRGSNSANFGVVFRRADPNTYYYFGINNARQYTVVSVLNLKVTTLRGWTIHTSLNRGQTNRLSIEAVGSRMRFYANDQLLTEIRDSTIPSGRVCLLVGIANAGESATVEFDNYQLHAP